MKLLCCFVDKEFIWFERYKCVWKRVAVCKKPIKMNKTER